MSLGIGRYKLGTNMLCGVGRHAGSQSCDAPCLVTDTRASDLSVDVAVNAALWPRLTPGAPGGPGEGAEAGQPSAEGKIMVPSQSGGPCRASLCLQKAEKAGVSQPQGPWLPAPCHCPPGGRAPRTRLGYHCTGWHVAVPGSASASRQPAVTGHTHSVSGPALCEPYSRALGQAGPPTSSQVPRTGAKAGQMAGDLCSLFGKGMGTVLDAPKQVPQSQ